MGRRIKPADRFSRSNFGSALVLTLLAVVLVSLAVLAFFASVTSNREIENSRAHNTQADELARTAYDYVAGQFLQEIANSANSTAYTQSGTIVYAPIANTNAVPARIVNTAIATDPNYFNLIRQSIAAADANASGDNTETAARNGPVIGTNQWNAPMLIAGGGFSTAGQLPNWIYVDRVKGVTKTASNTTIGRFAYNVYDIGGLLNANVAGYPSGVAADTNLVAQLKNTLAGADLTQLSPGNVTQSAVDQLVAFRNPTTGADTNTYFQSVQNASAAGYLTPNVAVTNSGTVTYYTNNFFNGRQDLLRYARTQNLPLTNVAPYLTTFCRSINAPSWEPQSDSGAGYTYLTSANSAASTNRFIPNVRAPTATSIPHYNDDGTLGSPTLVQPGDPLVQRRFSLAKLGWIAHGGPSKSTAFAPGLSDAAKAAAIQACFGLVWDTSTNPQGDPKFTSDWRWDYVGPTGSTIQSSIETLDQVAKESSQREPNFFELIQAGVLSGSLGTNGGSNTNDCSAGGIDMDAANSAYQVLRIGANIIDQTTPDNYPTAIAFMGQERTGVYGISAPTTLEVYGIKDLPYFNKIYYIFDWPTNNYSSPDPLSPTLPTGPVYNYISFELWNPHQFSSTAMLQNGPTMFRIRVSSDRTEPDGGAFQIEYIRQVRDPITNIPETAPNPQDDDKVEPGIRGDAVSSDGASPADPRYFISDPAVKDCPLVFASDGTSSDLQLSYREPHQIRNTYPSKFPEAAAPNTVFATAADGQGGEDPDLVAIDMGTSPADICPDGNLQGGNNLDFQIWCTVFVLEYQDTDGNWRPYTTFTGRPDRASTGVGGYWGNDGGRVVAFAEQINNAATPKGDPMTIRFDAQEGGNIQIQMNASENGSAIPGTWRPDNNSNPGIETGSSLSFFGSPDQAGPAYMGMLASNSHPGLAQTYTDPDGQMRPGDGYLQDQNICRENDAAVAAGGGSPSARSIILGRPFRSVAELGYVYRDDPFRTLDLFSNSSADGALLDMFCVSDEPAVTAGRVNLAAMPPVVQQSLSSGVSGVSNPATLASDYQTYTRNADQTPTTNIIRNVAQLPSFLSLGTTASFGSIYTKTAREAAVRAMAGPVQTRTWNFLIDVVAQSGRFPTASTSGSDFVVEGEKHCWLSVAIDRYTGKIVDQQIEFINE
jgi:Tfp pilus assembly protein PilX